MSKDLHNIEFDLNYAADVIKQEAAAVASMSVVIDEHFNSALKAIYHCQGSVILTGMGKAGIIGQKISATLASTGTPSHFLHPAEAVHGDLGRVKKDDIVLVLSYGGETDEIVRLINLLKQQEIMMIAITSQINSRLGKYADITLCMGKINEACPLGVAPTVSTTCMLAVGDSIALTVMKARNFTKQDYAKFHPGGSLGAQLITVRQSMMFDEQQPMPVALENDTIECMLGKTIKLQRHGAVMIVNAQGKLSGIITDGDLRRHFTAKGTSALKSKACEIMTANPKKICADALAAEAMAIFHKYRIDELPVVDSDSKPIGIIDVQDIVAIKVVN